MLRKRCLRRSAAGCGFRSHCAADHSTGQDSDRNPVFSACFDTTVRTFFNPPWTIRTEASIISDGAVSRPDRIQFRGNEIMVVDFKREKHHVRHREQLLSYMKLMADSQPGKRIRGLLLYVVSSQAIPIVVRWENGETQ